MTTKAYDVQHDKSFAAATQNETRIGDSGE